MSTSRPRCRFPACPRPAQADRRGRLLYCSYVHYRVCEMARAVAQSQAPPRGRDLARDAEEALRLVNVAADVGPGERLSREDYRSLNELTDAYRHRSGPRGPRPR